MRTQPDFQKLFFDHFGKQPKKVTYRVRDDSNRRHDLVFLSSLIHDARFTQEDFILKGKKLTINMNRDCWELGLVQHKKSSELFIADTRLTVAKVLDIKWHFSHSSMPNPATELWVGGLWLAPYPENGSRQFVIDGHDWSCQLELDDDDISIRLADKETPYLHSNK